MFLFKVVYLLIICSVGSVLFVAVDWFETNRRYAFVLKFLIIIFGASAAAAKFLR
jgi:hypothetical protein